MNQSNFESVRLRKTLLYHTFLRHYNATDLVIFFQNLVVKKNRIAHLSKRISTCHLKCWIFSFSVTDHILDLVLVLEKTFEDCFII